MISLAQARSLVERLAGHRILVVGDLMLDRYVFGSVDRISPEAPVPVVLVTRERAVAGGAANVAQNIQSLGGQAILAGLAGRDQAGQDLMGILVRNGIHTDGVVLDEQIRTIVKTRIFAERQQVVRVDRESPVPEPSDVWSALREKIGEVMPTVEGVIIEDYGKGAITQDVVDTVTAAARTAMVPVGLDPKDNHDLHFSWLTLATPNYAEACSAAGVPTVPLGGDLAQHRTLAAAGETLLEKWHCELLAITLGPHGMYLVSPDDKPRVIPTKAREVFDVCGAGDTVISTAMLAMASGADGYAAAALANYAAGVVVGKVGTATCTPSELVKYMEQEWQEGAA